MPHHRRGRRSSPATPAGRSVLHRLQKNTWRHAAALPEGRATEGSDPRPLRDGPVARWRAPTRLRPARRPWPSRVRPPTRPDEHTCPPIMSSQWLHHRVVPASTAPRLCCATARPVAGLSAPGARMRRVDHAQQRPLLEAMQRQEGRSQMPLLPSCDMRCRMAKSAAGSGSVSNTRASTTLFRSVCDGNVWPPLPRLRSAARLTRLGSSTTLAGRPTRRKALALKPYATAKAVARGRTRPVLPELRARAHRRTP